MIENLPLFIKMANQLLSCPDPGKMGFRESDHIKFPCEDACMEEKEKSAGDFLTFPLDRVRRATLEFTGSPPLSSLARARSQATRAADCLCVTQRRVSGLYMGRGGS